MELYFRVRRGACHINSELENFFFSFLRIEISNKRLPSFPINHNFIKVFCALWILQFIAPIEAN